MRRAAAALVLAVCVGALAGCGGGTADLSAPARAALHADIETVRTAVESDRTPAALKAVAGLRATVRKLADQGTLNGADAKVLLVQVDRLAAKLALRPSPGPTAVPTATKGPTPEPKAKSKGKGAAKGNGKK